MPKIISVLDTKLNEEKIFMLDVYGKLMAAEAQLAKGKILDGDASLKRIREKFKV